MDAVRSCRMRPLDSEDGADVQDGGCRAALVPARRGRSGAARLHGRARPAWAPSRRGCGGRSRASARRLEPLSHVELMLHQGSGELQTVTGADLRASHHESREDPYRLAVGLIGAEAMLRLFTEQEANERAFTALTRFLDRLDVIPSRAPAAPALDPLVLSFQLKLLWVSGYMPHLDSCVECGAVEGLVGYLPAAGGAVCRGCGGPARSRSRPRAVRAIQTLVRDAARRRGRGRADGEPRPRGARDRAGVVRAPGRLPPADALGVRKRARARRTSSTTTRRASTATRCTRSSAGTRTGPRAARARRWTG